MRMRLHCLLTPEASNILEKIVKFNKVDKSKVINQLILQKLANPIQILKEEKRQLAIRMNDIDTKIKDLEEKSAQKSA